MMVESKAKKSGHRRSDALPFGMEYQRKWLISSLSVGKRRIISDYVAFESSRSNAPRPFGGGPLWAALGRLN
jgi:hypothetical protein